MVWDDSRTLTPYLLKQEKLWSSKLGALLHETARKDLKRPGRLLSVFEEVADRNSELDQHLAWFSPVTNFPVVQNYRKAITNRTWLSHGDAKLHVQLESWEDSTLDEAGQRRGASPNLVHSVDAVHMMMVLSACSFDVAAIHDSWGTTPGQVSQLFRTIREQFVKLYDQKPLEQILEQVGCIDLLPAPGSLTLEGVLESDYCFC